MKTDALFYRLFRELPDCFFVLLGRPESDVRRYRFESIELKDTAVRLDGLYVPDPPDDREPAYFLEFQNHRSERVYSNLMLKIGLYLEKVNPRQLWRASVIYPSRSVEQENLDPYRVWLDSSQFTRVYLDELPETPVGNFSIGVLSLIAVRPGEALARAQALVPQVRSSDKSPEEQRKLIELIETVIAYQLPKISREEIEKMLQVESFRETRVYQEAFEEGRSETTEAIARRLLEMKLSVEAVAKATGLSAAQIKKLKKKKPG